VLLAEQMNEINECILLGFRNNFNKWLKVACKGFFSAESLKLELSAATYLHHRLLPLITTTTQSIFISRSFWHYRCV